MASQVRVTLYRNSQNPGEPSNILVNSGVSKADMLALCSTSLGISAKKIFNQTGQPLNSFETLTDGSILYVSQGEGFQVKKAAAVSSKKLMFAMLGAAAVGKSAITMRYVSNKFVKDYDPTIEDFYSKTAQIDNEAIQLSILDTAGMEDYESLIDHWIERKDAFILVFSVQLPETMQRLREFHSKILHRYEREPSKMPVIVVAGNKIDVQDRYVTKEQGSQLAAELGVPYYEVSAQSNINIDEMFTNIVRELRKRQAQPERKKKKSFCNLL